MKVAEYYSNSDIRIKKINKPKISDKEILVEMKACGVCGTDVMEWYRQKSSPKVLGHEMSGRVVEVGKKVTKFKRDDRVFVSHHVPCFNCHYCNNQNHSACDLLHTGNFYPGGFSEFIRIPEKNVTFGTFVLPEKMSFDEASMIEPMACAVAGQKCIQIEKRNTVLVLGSGISGLTHIQLAKNIGAKVIATDISQYRLKQAKYFGAEYTFNANELTIDKIKEINDGCLVDQIIICTGSELAVKNSFSYIDKKGKILFFAVSSQEISLPSVELWRNEISLFFSYGATTYDIEETMNLYKKERINFKDMITHRFPLSKIIEGFQMVEEANKSIKVVVNPDKD